jgi:hypothetical protein
MELGKYYDSISELPKAVEYFELAGVCLCVCVFFFGFVCLFVFHVPLFLLFLQFEHKNKIKQNKQKSKQIAKQNNVDAVFNLALLAFKQKDNHLSFSMFQKAARKNHPLALFSLGQMHMEGTGGVLEVCLFVCLFILSMFGFMFLFLFYYLFSLGGASVSFKIITKNSKYKYVNNHTYRIKNKLFSISNKALI